MALDRYQDAYLCAHRAAQHQDTSSESYEQVRCGLFCISGQSLINASIALKNRDSVLSALWEFAASVSNVVVNAPVLTQSQSADITHRKHVDLIKQYESQAAECFLTSDRAREEGYYRLAAALECRAWACLTIDSILSKYKRMFPWNGTVLMLLYCEKYRESWKLADTLAAAAGYAAVLREETHSVVRSLLSEALRLVDEAIHQHAGSEKPGAPISARLQSHVCDSAQIAADVGLALRAAFSARDKVRTEFPSIPTAAATALERIDEGILNITKSLQDTSVSSANPTTLLHLQIFAQEIRQALEVDLPRILFFAEESAAARQKDGAVYPLIARSWDQAAKHLGTAMVLGMGGADSRMRMHRQCCEGYVQLAQSVYAEAAESADVAARLSGDDQEAYGEVTEAFLCAAERIETALVKYADKASTLSAATYFVPDFKVPSRAGLEISIARSVSSAYLCLLGHISADNSSMTRLSIAACNIRLRLPYLLLETASFSEPDCSLVLKALSSATNELMKKMVKLLDASVSVPVNAPGAPGSARLRNIRDDATHVSTCLKLAESVRGLVRQVRWLASGDDLSESNGRKLLLVLRYCDSVCNQLLEPTFPTIAADVAGGSDDGSEEGGSESGSEEGGEEGGEEGSEEVGDEGGEEGGSEEEGEEGSGEGGEEGGEGGSDGETQEVAPVATQENAWMAPTRDHDRVLRIVDNLLRSYVAANTGVVAVFAAAARVLESGGKNIVELPELSEVFQVEDGDGAAPNSLAPVRETTVRDASLYISVQLSTHAHRMSEPDFQSEEIAYENRPLLDAMQDALDRAVGALVAQALASAAPAVVGTE
jgi:hypothetical protein